MTSPIDYPDWETAEHHALSIYNQTVPLGRKPGSIGSGSGTVTAGLTSTLASGVSLNQPSFQMLLFLSASGGAATIPFGMLKMAWTDSASGFSTTPDEIVLPFGSSTACTFYIYGPAKGDVLSIMLQDLDPAINISYSFGASQISHVYAQIRCQEVNQSPVSVFTRAGTFAQVGFLGGHNTAVPANGFVSRLAATWTGKAIFTCDNAAGPNTAEARLIDPGFIAGGSPLYGSVGTGILSSLIVPSGSSDMREVALPNGPVLIQVTNPGAAGAIQPTSTLIRIDQ